MANPKRTACAGVTKAGKTETMTETRPHGEKLNDRHREFLVVCAARCLTVARVRQAWAEQFPDEPPPIRETIQRYRWPRVRNHDKWGPVYDEERRRWMEETLDLPFAQQSSRVEALCNQADDLLTKIEDPRIPETREEVFVKLPEGSSKTYKPGRSDFRKELREVLSEIRAETGGGKENSVPREQAVYVVRTVLECARSLMDDNAFAELTAELGRRGLGPVAQLRLGDGADGG